MPDDIPLAVFVLGAVLLLLALTTGPVKVFGAEVAGTKGRIGRGIAGVVGALLIGASLWHWLVAAPTSATKEAGPPQQKPGSAPQQAKAAAACDGFPQLECVKWGWSPYSAVVKGATHHFVTNECTHNVIVALCRKAEPTWSCRIEPLSPKEKRIFEFAGIVEIEGPLGDKKARLLSKAAECHLDFPTLK